MGGYSADKHQCPYIYKNHLITSKKIQTRFLKNCCFSISVTVSLELAYLLSLWKVQSTSQIVYKVNYPLVWYVWSIYFSGYTVAIIYSLQTLTDISSNCWRVCLEVWIHTQRDITGVLPVWFFFFFFSFMLTVEVHLTVVVLPHLCLDVVLLLPLRPKCENIPFPKKEKHNMHGLLKACWIQ